MSDFQSIATFGTFPPDISSAEGVDLATWGWFSWKNFANILLSGTVNIVSTLSGTVDVISRLAGTVNIPSTLSGTVNLE